MQCSERGCGQAEGVGWRVEESVRGFSRVKARAACFWLACWQPSLRGCPPPPVSFARASLPPHFLLGQLLLHLPAQLLACLSLNVGPRHTHSTALRPHHPHTPSSPPPLLLGAAADCAPLCQLRLAGQPGRSGWRGGRRRRRRRRERRAADADARRLARAAALPRRIHAPWAAGDRLAVAYHFRAPAARCVAQVL